MGARGLRIALVGVDLLAALSAIVGAIGLVVGFMNIPLNGLHGTPFADFTVPALLLGFVVGGSALAAAAIALFRPWRGTLLGSWRLDALASALAGCIMVGWMTVEVAMLGLVIWVQAAYFVVGLLMVGLAVLLHWSESQQRAEPHQTGGHGQQRAA
jgi:hypothetical protein